ncbi:hypothetical protein GUITHDRAFT_148490 [Guillardia theta CCMP2712]|uniref:Protein kinase domain-containing protein n=1 Tax=Guillardia theta (strain CCMP2712) TaxID=905079 RepID=L1I8S3_GUITC|nr:hypothetical protein GUITHDRAFT_148490 [Guillardia theta CCMP2712]EKX32633.1 hypothetical protein GUITHDRAFT_148490 [Guillardia theta CCMP2712]|eukprot:XP_005819613.1 hypothetical protein GUITHDRAFT_148490 [Guillardia theta CCMP2712]
MSAKEDKSLQRFELTSRSSSSVTGTETTSSGRPMHEADTNRPNVENNRGELAATGCRVDQTYMLRRVEKENDNIAESEDVRQDMERFVGMQVLQTLCSEDEVILVAISQKNIRGARKQRKSRPPPQGWDISPVRKRVAKDHKNGLKEVWVEGTDFIRLKSEQQALELEFAKIDRKIDMLHSEEILKEQIKKLQSKRQEIHSCDCSKSELDRQCRVRLFDVFEIDKNSFCTVLEMCHGDLETHLNRCGPLCEEECRTIMRQVLSGLAYLDSLK